MTTAKLIAFGESRSFPAGDPFLERSSPSGEVLVLLGAVDAAALHSVSDAKARVLLVELDEACLGRATGEDFGREGGRVIGFARYRIGEGLLTQSIELVVQPHTEREAIDAAVALFTAAGYAVSICRDVPGRILDQLMRPYFNRALEALDRGLAEAGDLDKALKMGLGFPRGPIEILGASGLAHHCAVARRLYDALGESGQRPARRAQLAAERSAH